MKVSELVAIMDKVAPAMSANEKVKLMNSFWFRDGNIITFNDWVGMQAPCDMKGLEFTAPPYMLDLLRVSYQGGEVEFEMGKKQPGPFKVFVGKNVGEFGTRVIDDTRPLFDMPQIKTNSPVFADKLGKLQAAIDVLMLSVGTNQMNLENLGVTIINEEDGLTLYSFDENCISRCILPGGYPGKAGQRICVIGEFWPIFQSLTKGRTVKEAKREVAVMLDAKHVVAKVGDVMLYGKVIPVQNPSPLADIANTHFSKAVEKQLQPITPKIARLIARAAVLSSNDAGPTTRVEVDGGRLYIQTDGGKGHADDVVEFDHPNTPPILVPANKLTPVDNFEKMAIGKKVICFTSPDRLYICGGVSAKE